MKKILVLYTLISIVAINNSNAQLIIKTCCETNNSEKITSVNISYPDKLFKMKYYDGLQTINKNKSNITVGINLGIPVFWPEDDFDFLQSGFLPGVEVTYGKVVFLGISFDYHIFTEDEQIHTGTEGPEPLGKYKPQIHGSFFSTILGYNPFTEKLISPFMSTKIGLLKRKYDLNFEDYSYDDKIRFAVSYHIGCNIRVNSQVSLTFFVSYFLTSTTDNEDWKFNFDSVRESVSANIGARFCL